MFGVDLKRFSLNGNQDIWKLKRELSIREDTFVIGTAAIFRPEKAYHIFFEGIEKIRPSIKGSNIGRRCFKGT